MIWLNKTLKKLEDVASKHPKKTIFLYALAWAFWFSSRALFSKEYTFAAPVRDPIGSCGGWYDYWVEFLRNPSEYLMTDWFHGKMLGFGINNPGPATQFWKALLVFLRALFGDETVVWDFLVFLNAF